MTIHPTRILLSDLDDNIREIFHSLLSFQGDHLSLLHRLQNLTVQDFSGDTRAIILDLITGLNEGKGTAVERLRQLEDASLTIDGILIDLGMEPEVDEYYTYNADGDVTLHRKYKPGSTAAADLLESTEYIYGDLSLTIAEILAGATAGAATAKGIALRRSVKSFRNSRKQKVTITKDYLYNADQNITGIQTRRKVDNLAPIALTESAMSWSSTANSFTINWVNPTSTNTFDFDHVRVRLYRQDGTILSESPELRGTTTYTFNGLTAGTQYRFEIVSVDDSYNESPRVTDVFYAGVAGGETTGGVTVTPGTGTGAPQALNTFTIDARASRTMNVSWTMAADVNYHHAVIKVYNNPDEGFLSLLQEIHSSPGALMHIISNLEPDTRYKIEAYGANINGDLSAPITITEKTVI